MNRKATRPAEGEMLSDLPKALTLVLLTADRVAVIGEWQWIWDCEKNAPS